MKRIILFITILISLNAETLECNFETVEREVYSTMSNTYKNDGHTASMWFESKKIVKKKVIETSKSKIEVQANQMFRVTQLAIYTKNGVVKDRHDGRYDEFQEAIPGSLGEWMWNTLNGWAYIVENNLTKKEHDIECIQLRHGINHHGYAIGQVRDPILDESTEDKMTLEETKKWLEENKPYKLEQNK